MIAQTWQGPTVEHRELACAPTSDAKEAEAEWFCEDLKDLLELTPNKDVLFIIGD